METPVQEAEVSKTEGKVEAPKPSKAQDLRDIQQLLVMGIFPGNMAPTVCKAYSLLEKMAVQVESNDKENKA